MVFLQFIPLTETDLELPGRGMRRRKLGYWCRQICNPTAVKKERMEQIMVNTDEKYMKEAIKQAKRHMQ